jgi:hypothetical protein
MTASSAVLLGLGFAADTAWAQARYVGALLSRQPTPGDKLQLNREPQLVRRITGPAHPWGEIIMQEENTALEAQNQRLQSLVCELLLTNQKLRIELNELRQQKSSTQAAHPPQFRDR